MVRLHSQEHCAGRLLIQVEFRVFQGWFMIFFIKGLDVSFQIAAQDLFIFVLLSRVPSFSRYIGELV